jgi:signal transduction histidine kinase/CheY-like chemotaxis protein/HAMP domain-containing protein
MSASLLNRVSVWVGSIRGRLILGVALIHAVLMTFFVVDISERQSLFLRSQSVEQTMNIAETLAASAVPWILVGDVVGLEEVVMSQSSFPALQFVMVHDLQGRILGYTDRSMVGKYVDDEISLGLLSRQAEAVILQNDNQLVDVGVPVLAAGKQIAWVRVGVDQRQIADNILIIFRDGALYSLAAILAGIFFAFLVSKRLVKGLSEIMTVANGISGGATQLRVAPSGTDEVGKLGAVFNAMLDAQDAARQTALANEQRFDGVFENSVVAIWNQDYRGVYLTLEDFRRKGVTDLRDYLQQNPKLLTMLARKVRVINVNRAGARLFSAELSRDVIEQVYKQFDEEVAAVFLNQVCAIWDKQTVFEGEAKFTNFAGQHLDVIVTFQIPETEEGFACIPVSLIDITERKKLEAQLRQAQKMEALGQLTGGIAHDFNNMLAIILGNADLLALSNMSASGSQRRLENIIKSAESAKSLTGRLLAFSRQQTLLPQLMDVNRSLTGIKDLLARSLGEQVEIVLQFADTRLNAVVDETQFENAVINLAVNARDAMSAGGTLQIETSAVVLDSAAALRLGNIEAGKYALVRVIDEGCGMQETVAGNAFEPFFTTKEIGKGSGLGLSMVYGFAAQSGGYVELQSEVDQGTTVSLYLPQRDIAENAGKTGEKTDKEPGNSNVKAEGAPVGGAASRIMVVEDEKSLRDISVLILKQQGYEVAQAGDAETALQQLTNDGPFDVLFTDVTLPGTMTGLDIAARARQIQPDISIVFTTGYADNEALTLSLLAHDGMLLAKPYRRLEMLSIISQATAGRQA